MQAARMPGHVEVAVRVRPLLSSEEERGESVAVQAASTESLPDPAQQPQGRRQAVCVLKPSTAKAALPKAMAGRKAASAVTESRTFAFDSVAGPTVSQVQLFQSLNIAAMCDDAFEGKAVTVFCFGQTGSGKTYTLSGKCATEGAEDDPAGTTGNEDGLQFQAARYIAAQRDRLLHPPAAPVPQTRDTAPAKERLANKERKQKRSASAVAPQPTTTEGLPLPPPPPPPLPPRVAVSLRASFVELYNEHLFDLLQEGKGGLKCRWSAAAQSFFVEDSLIVQCESEEDLVMVLREGHAYRHRAAHRLNSASSRSHAIFTVFVETQPEGQEGQPVRYGKITFVDLAGSERLKETGSSGSDTKSINRSLFALGNVIEKLSALSDAERANPSGPARGFIPYRSSILTQLLMDSLHGQSRTLMIACVSPSSRFVDESLRTLHYAQRARHIATQPAVRLDAEEEQRLRMEVELRRLRRENRLLRAALRLPLAADGSHVDGGEEMEELTVEQIQAHLSALLAAAAHEASAAAAGALTKAPPVRLRPSTTEHAVTRAAPSHATHTKQRAASYTPPSSDAQAGNATNSKPSGGGDNRAAGRLPSLPAAVAQASEASPPAVGAKDQRHRSRHREAVTVSDTSLAEDEVASSSTQRLVGDAGGGTGWIIPPYPFPPAGGPPPVSALDLLERLPDTADLPSLRKT